MLGEELRIMKSIQGIRDLVNFTRARKAREKSRTIVLEIIDTCLTSVVESSTERDMQFDMAQDSEDDNIPLANLTMTQTYNSVDESFESSKEKVEPLF